MNLDVTFIKSILTVYDELVCNGISLVYLGEFNQEITKMFTSMAEEDMDKQQEEMGTKRKVYHIMVETLQNMNKHSDDLSEQGDIGKGLFMIGKKDETYYIITSNKIDINKTEKLKLALHTVNNADRKELSEMYKKQIKEGSLSDKGGAGLGLIDIARKSRSRLDYHFLPYNDEYDFFILKVEINGKKLREERAEKKEQKQKEQENKNNESA